MVIQGISYPSDFEAKKAMIAVATAMAARDFVIAGDGSLSVRAGPNAIWITERDADKSALTQDKFIRVDLNGKQMMSARPRALPEDLPIHLKLYAENETLRGILHAYPVAAAVLSATGCGMAAADYSPAVRALGALQLLPAAPAEETARAIGILCKTENGAILSGDGCMLWGASLQEAFRRLQALEYAAKIARALGSCPAHAAPAPLYTPAPVCAPAPARGGYAPPVTLPAPSTEGLTPLIRPGDTTGFHLPSGGAASPAPAAKPAPVYTPAQPAVSVAAVPAASASRDKVMAEVVRRTLAGLK